MRRGSGRALQFVQSRVRWERHARSGRREPSPGATTHARTPHALTRRGLLRGAAAAGAAALAGVSPHAVAADDKAVTKGRIKQSIVFWCFNGFGDKWDIDTTCQIAKELGCVSVELMAPELWAPLKKNGLTCAIAPNGMPGMPVPQGLQQPEVPRRSHRPHEEDDRRLRRRRRAERDRLQRLQVARLRGPQERRDPPRRRGRQLRQGLQADHRLRREEGRDDLHGAPQHARQVAPDEGPSRLPGRRPRLDGRRSSARSARRG